MAEWVGGGRVGRKGGGRESVPVVEEVSLPLPSAGVHRGWIRRLHPCRGPEQSERSRECTEVGSGRRSLVSLEKINKAMGGRQSCDEDLGGLPLSEGTSPGAEEQI